MRHGVFLKVVGQLMPVHSQHIVYGLAQLKG